MFFNNKNKEYVQSKYLQDTGSEMIRWSQFNSTRVKRILVTYSDVEDRKKEITVNRDAFGEKYISVYFTYETDFEIPYPQQIILKFVTDEALYIIETELKDIIREKNIIYFTIKAPPQIERRQQRSYYRLNLIKNVILVANDTSLEDGMLMSLAKIINLSAGGVKIGKVESLFQDNNTKNKDNNIRLSMYKNFYVVLILNSKTLIRLKARFVRYEKSKDGDSEYCLKFVDQSIKDIDTISKFIIVEQMNQKKLEKEAKQQFTEAIKNRNRR